MSSPAAARVLPLRKKTKLSLCPIDKLPDSLLAKIFTQLPFKDRFLACGVSQKWAAASLIPWTDIFYLDLNLIPNAMVKPILDLCPKVEQIEALNHTIILKEEDTNLPIREHVRALKLRNVKFTMVALDSSDEESRSKFASILCEYLKQFPDLTELIWQDILAVPIDGPGGETGQENLPTAHVEGEPYHKIELGMPDSLAASLKRLALINTWLTTQPAIGVPIFLNTQEEMRKLECLHVESNVIVWRLYSDDMEPMPALPADAPNLRELCLVETGHDLNELADTVSEELPNLEVLVFASQISIATEGIANIIKNPHPTLRIFVVAGMDLGLALHHKFQLEHPDEPLLPIPVLIPARVPPGGGQVSPPLQIFVGGCIASHVRFALSHRLSGVTFHLIDSPMPQFLAKPGVATIFEGVWSAGVIREGPKYGPDDWAGAFRHRFYSSAPLLFS